MAAKPTHSAYIAGKHEAHYPGHWHGPDADDLDNVPEPYKGPAPRPTKNTKRRPYDR